MAPRSIVTETSPRKLERPAAYLTLSALNCRLGFTSWSCAATSTSSLDRCSCVASTSAYIPLTARSSV